MLKKAWDCSKRKIVFSKESKEEDRELWLLGGEGKMENRKRISSRLENLETIVREERRFSKRNVSDRVSSMVKLWNQSNLEKPG